MIVSGIGSGEQGHRDIFYIFAICMFLFSVCVFLCDVCVYVCVCVYVHLHVEAIGQC